MNTNRVEYFPLAISKNIRTISERIDEIRQITV